MIARPLAGAIFWVCDWYGNAVECDYRLLYRAMVAVCPKHRSAGLETVDGSVTQPTQMSTSTMYRKLQSRNCIAGLNADACCFAGVCFEGLTSASFCFCWFTRKGVKFY